MVKSYKDLIVWQKSIKLVKSVYRVCSKLPKSELYALSDQMRRASVSIPSNIAEGCMRNHTKEYIQFLYISQGSCAELETQLIIAKELDFIDSAFLEEISNDIEIIQKMLSKLIKSLKNR